MMLFCKVVLGEGPFCTVYSSVAVSIYLELVTKSVLGIPGFKPVFVSLRACEEELLPLARHSFSQGFVC